ncbi:MAG: cytidylate kinase-like family protein [Lachnospiraceae bacterium]|nr:cytidylate kinase-like family protein [Lachnospiraceae bacterium]
MEKKIIYTIGREFASGGKSIAKKLSEKLGIPYYDKELLARAARSSGIAEEIFKLQDEKPTNSFLYSLVMDTYSFGGYHAGASFLEMPLNQRVFLAQFDAIKKIAAEGSCIIVGRCADYALAEEENCINTFIYADKSYRIKRISKELELDENKAKDLINRMDKERASYYNFYTSKKWGDSRSYDICLNSEKLGIDGCVEMLLAYTNIVL